MRTATIHARIQPGLKTRAEEIFAESGHTTSEVLEQFYVQTVKRGRVPIRLNKRRAKILDENLNSPEEIRAALDLAKKSAQGQFDRGKYITAQDARAHLREKYGLKV